MRDPVFLTLAEVIEVHCDQIERYGGEHGLRDLNLLQSAVAQPEATFSKQWLHDDYCAMASAYAYHICQNHPFVDGNKRTALVCALVFLDMNGNVVEDCSNSLFDVMLKCASGKMTKTELADVFRKLVRG